MGWFAIRSVACEPSGLAGPVCQRLVRISRGMSTSCLLGIINNFTRLPRAGRAVGHVSTQRRLAQVVGWLVKLVGFLGVQSSNSLDVQVEMGIQFYQFIRLQIDFYKCKPNQLNPLILFGCRESVTFKVCLGYGCKLVFLMCAFNL